MYKDVGLGNKTATVSFRIHPDVKNSARLAATSERRSLSNWLEVLIINHCKDQKKNAPSKKQRET